MRDENIEFNRAAFLAGSLGAMGLGLTGVALGAEPAGAGVAPDEGLARLIDGNKRFVANELPVMNNVAEKRALLVETQSPFAAILSCSDSRVIPELIFTQGLGQLFVARVAGNYPDDLVIGSLEYAVEHLGTRLIMVLGHQNCGAVKAVYTAIETRKPLPPHLDAIEELIAPGLERVVHARGDMKEAVEANVRAAAATLRKTSPVISAGVESGHLQIASAVYQLGSGRVRLID